MFSGLEGFVGEFSVGLGSEYRVDSTGYLSSALSHNHMQELAYLLGENNDMCHNTLVEHFRA
jgi:hypothetical protein